jgi:hypothetical protein
MTDFSVQSFEIYEVVLLYKVSIEIVANTRMNKHVFNPNYDISSSQRLTFETPCL